jgi:hypothetical protein
MAVLNKNRGKHKWAAFRGIAMRTSTWAIFLFVSLKAVASVATAHAAPTTEPIATVAGPSTAVDRPATDEQRSQRVVQVNHERKPETIQAKPLSKDFSSPKPVQIYWFFGGR